MTQEGNEFDKGWFSGTLSVSLAVIGLLAVFCFHFPSYLTIPDVREYYPLPWIRLALHIVLVSAFLLGLMTQQHPNIEYDSFKIRSEDVQPFLDSVVIPHVRERFEKQIQRQKDRNNESVIDWFTLILEPGRMF